MKTAMNKEFKHIFLACFGTLFLCTPNFLCGQEIPLPRDPDASLRRAMALASEGRREEARDTLKAVLTHFPDYTDVKNLLAKTYSWDGNYEEARRQFNRITSFDRSNKEVWEAAIRNEIYAGNKNIALGLANKALIYLPDDHGLAELRDEVSNSWNESAEVAELEKTTGESPLDDASSVAVFSSADVFDVVFDPMYYSGLEFNLRTGFGRVVPRINYSNRFGVDGIQYEVDLYPRFSKSVYAYLNYGYSQSEIYPEHRVGGDLYLNLPGGIETSLGARFLSFIDSDVTIITGSAGFYSGNYYFSLRPYLTPRDNNTMGISGVITARRYLRDARNYIGVNAGMGFMPEFRQFRANSTLIAETLLFVESQQLMLEYQFSFKSNPSLYRAQLGITRQELVFATGNFFWAFSAGLRYQVEF
jgi:YaiO family outer membrane protein